MESYELSSAVLFNEEGLLAGKLLPLLVKNSLKRNGELISLDRLKKFHMVITTNSGENVVDSKAQRDLALSDTEDLVVDIMVPP